MTTDLAELETRIGDHYRRVHREVFLGDPAANPKLKVEVVSSGMAGDTPTLVLITPWTLNGMIFTPDGDMPETLTVNAKQHPVFFAEVQGLGAHHAINLAGDVSALPDQDAARTIADALKEPFRLAVEQAREAAAVADPERRRLLRRDR